MISPQMVHLYWQVPVSQAGGGHFGALDLHVVVLVFVGGKVGRQHHTARVASLGIVKLRVSLL